MHQITGRTAPISARVPAVVTTTIRPTALRKAEEKDHQ